MNHLTIRQSVIGSVYAKRRRESFFGVYGTPEAALSLQDLGKGGNSLEVVRSSDSAITDFNYPQITDGTLLAWVNGADNEVMNNPEISSASGWTIGGNTTYNSGTEAFDLAAESGLTVRQDQSEEGITYEVTVTISSYTSGGIRIYAGGNQSAIYNSVGTHTFTIIGGSSNAILGINPSSASTLSISAFSVIQKTAKGEVRTIYGPNSINFVQTTSSERALIVDNGVLVEENGRPALKCNGSTTNYDLSSAIDLTGEFYILVVMKATGANPYAVLGGNTANDDALLVFDYQLRVKINNTNYSNSGVSGVLNGVQKIIDFQRDASNNLIETINGTTYGSTVAGASGTFTFNIIGTNIALNSIAGTLQEILIYSGDKSGQLTSIRSNRNEYYAIP